MEKLDLRKALGTLYRPSASRPALVDVPPLRVLALDGIGDPNTSAAFRQGIEALYPLAYTLKFALKKEGTADYVVMPLEALGGTGTTVPSISRTSPDGAGPR